MKTASVRSKRSLRQGSEIQITKRKQVIARLMPPKRTKRPKIPDFMAMLKEIYGDKVHKITGAELISQQRAERQPH